MTDARRELEHRAKIFGRAIASQLPDGVGFTLILYDFGGGGNMAYLSNGERADVAKMLIELGDKMLEGLER